MERSQDLQLSSENSDDEKTETQALLNSPPGDDHAQNQTQEAARYNVVQLTRTLERDETITNGIETKDDSTDDGSAYTIVSQQVACDREGCHKILEANDVRVKELDRTYCSRLCEQKARKCSRNGCERRMIDCPDRTDWNFSYPFCSESCKEMIWIEERKHLRDSCRNHKAKRTDELGLCETWPRCFSPSEKAYKFSSCRGMMCYKKAVYKSDLKGSAPRDWPYCSQKCQREDPLHTGHRFC